MSENDPMTTGTDPGRPRSRWSIVAAVVAGAAIVIATVVVLATGDSGTDTATTTDGAPTTAPLTTGATPPSSVPAPRTPSTTHAAEPDLPPLGDLDVGELGPGAPIPGIAGALAFVAPSPDGTPCTLVLPPERDVWKEACGLAPGAALTSLLDATHEIAIDSSGLVVSGQRLDSAPPSNGCALGSVDELLAQLPPTSVVDRFGCLDDDAAVSTAPVMLQNGPPDGSIWVAERNGGTWAITDSGTGLDGNAAFEIVGEATWSTWTANTRARRGSFATDAIIAIPPQADPAALADAVLAALGELDVDPEFPLDERIVAVEPDGRSLIVAEVDLGGDDSVSGAVYHVWISDDGAAGWVAADVLRGDVCARADATGRELCP